LADKTFQKTKFSSHISFLHEYLRSDLVPNVFVLKFHASHREQSRSSRYKHQISSILRENIITRNFHLLRDDPDRAAIFQPLRILCAYRRHNNLRDSLVRSVRSTLNDTTPTSEDRGTFPCGQSRCNTCEKRKSAKSTAKTLKHSGDRKFTRKKQNRKQEYTEENSRRNHVLRKKSCQIRQAKSEPTETPRIRQK